MTRRQGGQGVMLNAVEESNSDGARILQPRTAEPTIECFGAHKRENVGEKGPYGQPGDRWCFSGMDTGWLCVGRGVRRLKLVAGLGPDERGQTRTHIAISVNWLADCHLQFPPNAALRRLLDSPC